MNEKIKLGVITALLAGLVIGTILIGLEVAETERELDAARQRVAELEAEQEELLEQQEILDRLDSLDDKVDQLERHWQNWLDAVGVEQMSVTKYAPLDPAAVPGMCYSGNPAITASGEKVIPGQTCAAGPGVPFGSKVIVPGKGIYRVNDRGGAIGNSNLDLAAESRAAASRWGRQNRTVIVVE